MFGWNDWCLFLSKTISYYRNRHLHQRSSSVSLKRRHRRRRRFVQQFLHPRLISPWYVQGEMKDQLEILEHFRVNFQNYLAMERKQILRRHLFRRFDEFDHRLDWPGWDQEINSGQDYFELWFFVAAAGAAAGNVEDVELCTGSNTGFISIFLKTIIKDSHWN